MPDYGDDLSDVMAELSGLLLSEENLETTLQRVADLSSRIIPAAETGVTLIENGRMLTAAATSDLVRDLDEIQYDMRQGPCVEAMKNREMTYVPDLATDPRFPDFAPAAKERGVKALSGVPLIVRGESMGCLNLYCTDGEEFTPDDLQAAQMFGRQASVSLHNSYLYFESVRLAEQLQEALGSRAVIDQAKGILMQREGVGADEAFAMLKEASQNTNIKVRAIAQKIVDEANPQGRSKTDP